MWGARQTPTGKPFEAGTRGFWKDYPNIEDLVAQVRVTPVLVRRRLLLPAHEAPGAGSAS
jgi:hypothetical protein